MPSHDTQRGRPSSGTTVKRLTSILTFLARRRSPTSATELARGLGMTRSTVSRLANALVEEGLVQRDRTNGYILGILPIVLGRAALAQRPLQAVARPWLDDLVETTNEAASLSVLHDDRIVYLDYIAPDGGLDMGVTPGRTISASTSGMGKMMLAGLPDADIERYLSETTFESRTPRSITSAAVLREQIMQIRTKGFSIDDEETALGMRCVAAPVFDAAGNTIAAVSISGPAPRLTYERLEQASTDVRRCAAGISSDLGYMADQAFVGGVHDSEAAN